MDVSVDPGKCQGHARCYLIAPEVFDLDEEGFAFVLKDAPVDANLEAVRSAVLNCPENAISLS